MTIGAGIEIGMLGGDEAGHEVADQSASTIDKMVENFQQLQSDAIFLDLVQTGTVLAGGTVLIDLGTPPASYYWIVRSIYISDAQLWTNTATGTAQFGKGTIPPNVTQMPALTVRWAFITMPAQNVFSSNQWVVKHGERLFAQVQAGTAAQILQASATVEQWSVFARTDAGAGPKAHAV